MNPKYLLLFLSSLTAVGIVFVNSYRVNDQIAVPTSNQLSDARGPVQNVRFTLYGAGIFPQQQRARPGNVIISVEDRTHRSTGLVVQQDVAGIILPIGQVSPTVNRVRGRAQFNLGAGNYAVFDASQPNNRAELVIEP